MAPKTGPTTYIQKSVHSPDASAGPNERAGFIDAPVTGPPNSASSPTAPPMAIAAAAPTARVSVATATITNISTAVSTPSYRSAVADATWGTVAPSAAGLFGHAASSTNAAAAAPISWAET